MTQPVWVIINCNSTKEATSIGNEILKERLASCFDVFNRHSASFFWPPKSGKIETAKGAMLILETLENNYDSIILKVKKLHSDKLPFIGYLKMEGVTKEYLNWMEGELKK